MVARQLPAYWNMRTACHARAWHVLSQRKVEVRKGAVGRRPRTWFRLTAAGRQAVAGHLAAAELVPVVPDGHAGRDEVVERRLADGSTFRVIKNFVDPTGLEDRLRGLGLDCEIRRDGNDWVVGEARLGSEHAGAT
jgi:hypothetical protein